MTVSDGLTVPQAAAYLAARGYPCSLGTVRALAKSGRLKHQRPGPSARGDALPRISAR